MPTTAIFLVCLVVAPQASDKPGEPLTNEDLLEINQTYVDVSEYADNEFLYEEKMRKAIVNAQKYQDRLVTVVARVERVTKDSVEVVLFPTPLAGRCY